MDGSFLGLSAVSAAGIISLGFVQGLSHATDADHLAAVGTIVSEKKSVWRSSLIGGIWGLGHTLALLAVGFLVLFLDFQVTGATEAFLEGAVGVMLMLLGLNTFRKILRERRYAAGAELPHSHGQSGHAEDGHGPAGSPMLSPRALTVGLMHGLAGSAGLMLAVIPTIDSKTVGIFYIAVFGFGSIGGMMIMSFLVGLPFHLSSFGPRHLTKVFQGIAGAASIAIGALIVYEKAAG